MSMSPVLTLHTGVPAGHLKWKDDNSQHAKCYLSVPFFTNSTHLFYPPEEVASCILLLL